MDAPVERADLFRYLVVYLEGGVYADLDTAAAAPLSGWLRPDDALVAGWEADSAGVDAMLARGDVRRRQALQWAFAARAGHPALLLMAERIADAVLGDGSARALGADSDSSTLERTGPGLFTDALRHAARRAAAGDEKWRVRFLPRVAMATNWDAGRGRWELADAAGGGGPLAVPEGDERVVLRHYAAGSWKAGGRREGGLLGRKVRRKATRLVARVRRALLPSSEAIAGTTVAPSKTGTRVAASADADADDAQRAWGTLGSYDSVTTREGLVARLPARERMVGGQERRTAAFASLAALGEGSDGDEAALDAILGACGGGRGGLVVDAAPGSDGLALGLRVAARGASVAAVAASAAEGAELRAAVSAAAVTTPSGRSIQIVGGEGQAVRGDAGARVRCLGAAMSGGWLVTRWAGWLVGLPKRLIRQLWRVSGGVAEVDGTAWDTLAGARLQAYDAAPGEPCGSVDTARTPLSAGSLLSAMRSLRASDAQAGVACALRVGTSAVDPVSALTTALAEVRPSGSTLGAVVLETAVVDGAMAAAVSALRSEGFTEIVHAGPGCRQRMLEAGKSAGQSDTSARCPLPQASDGDLSWWCRGGGVETIVAVR